jgi:predicted metal-binding membrane protein
MPDVAGANSFEYGYLAADIHGLMVSLLPYDVADAPVAAATSSVDIHAYSLAFVAQATAMVAPSTAPVAAVDPDSANAKALLASAIALASISMTLF